MLFVALLSMIWSTRFVAVGFTMPTSRMMPPGAATTKTFASVSSLTSTAALDDIVAMNPSTTLFVADTVEVLKNVFLGVGGIVALLAAVAVLFSTFIIPKAAEQLETQAKELDPLLWEEYAEKLGPNEVLAVRPDLMQELGEKVQAMMVAKFEEAERRQAAKDQSEQQESSDPPVIDAEVISEKPSDK